MKFTKMHGLGNDILIIDQDQDIDSHAIQSLSHRYLGIGFDQCLYITNITGEKVSTRIYNADGQQVYQCGNGLRCLMAYLAQNYGLSNAEIIVGKYTYHGIMQPNGPSINMGQPSFSQTTIPTTLDITGMVTIHLPHTCSVGIVHIGNPHAICLWPDENMNRENLAKDIQQSGFFPEGINVSFMKVSPTQLELETHERGVGKTEACGSAACAAVIIAHQFLSQKKSNRVKFTHGHLDITITHTGVWQTGPATFVFEGCLK